MRSTYRTALYDPAADKAAAAIRYVWYTTNRCTEDVLLDVPYSWAAMANDKPERDSINALIDKIEREDKP